MIIFGYELSHKKFSLILLALIVTAGVFFYFFWQLNHNNLSQNINQYQPKIKDASICDSISVAQDIQGRTIDSDLALKDECYQNVAIALRDDSICSKVVSVQYQCSSLETSLGMTIPRYCDYSEQSCVKAVADFSAKH